MAAEELTVKNLELLLGKNFDQVFSEIGLPVQMFPVRQNDDVMDDIVMVYETDTGPFYLYFYNNDYYRVLIPSVSKADFYGIRIGDSSDKLKELYGDKLSKEDNYAHYINGDRHFIFNIEADKVKNIWMILEGKPQAEDD